MASRTRTLRGSLGDSWGDADYSTDDAASLRSLSSISDAESDSASEADVATPLPSRASRAASQTQRHAPRTTARMGEATRRTPRAFQHAEPSFVMPSMRAPTRSASYVRHPQHRTARQSHSTSMPSSPQVRYRRASSNFGPADRTPQEAGPDRYAGLVWAHFFKPLVQYALSVIWYTMNHFLKPLFATALAIFLLTSLLRYSSVFLMGTLSTALAPLCIVPGSSYVIPLCNSYTSGTSPAAKDADFAQLSKVQGAFEDVLATNKDTYELPATLKSSEGSLRDLRTIIRHSQLPSRAELVNELSSFIETAGDASKNLADYNAKLGNTMGQVISTNRLTLNILESIAHKELATGSLGRALNYLNPYAEISTQERVHHQYIEHVGAVQERIELLIQRSQDLLALLNRLESQLDVISDIAMRDDLILSRDHEALLSNIWTTLGGNRAENKGFKRSLDLLRNIQRYRKMAVEHVGATLLKLQEVAAELENLREGVAAPAVVGYREHLPLTWYIEVVQASIDRLDRARGQSLEMERNELKKRLAGGETTQGRLELDGRVGGTTVFASAGARDGRWHSRPNGVCPRRARGTDVVEATRLWPV